MTLSPLTPEQGMRCSRCGKTPLRAGRTQGWCRTCTRRARIEQTAQALVASSQPSWVLLDTETSGLLAGQDEVLDLAMLSAQGTTLFSSLIRPLAHQVDGSEAQRTHHITDAQLADAPTFAEIWPQIAPLFASVQTVITYNAPFDRGLLAGDARRAGVSLPAQLSWWCLMDAFAHWYGESRSSWSGGYRWQKLATACQILGVDTHTFASEHRALGDAQRAHAVLLALAARAPEHDIERHEH